MRSLELGFWEAGVHVSLDEELPHRPGRFLQKVRPANINSGLPA